jgi:type II secretory pathway component PulF
MNGSGELVSAPWPGNQPRAEDVTVFTQDLALLLRAGARVNDGLELLAGDRDIGRLRPVVGRVPLPRSGMGGTRPGALISPA